MNDSNKYYRVMLKSHGDDSIFSDCVFADNSIDARNQASIYFGNLYQILEVFEDEYLSKKLEKL